jgi:hypothetical protein
MCFFCYIIPNILFYSALRNVCWMERHVYWCVVLIFELFSASYFLIIFSLASFYCFPLMREFVTCPWILLLFNLPFYISSLLQRLIFSPHTQSAPNDKACALPSALPNHKIKKWAGVEGCNLLLSSNNTYLFCVFTKAI